MKRGIAIFLILMLSLVSCQKTHTRIGVACDARIERLCEEKKLCTISREEQCREIYAFVHDKISYGAEGGMPRERTDIETTVCQALDRMSGDCYAHAVLSKAFFDYLGMDSYIIERTHGKTSDTHFWNYVNIGSEKEPRWYHFDATPLARKYSLCGCLFTQEQLEAYERWREGDYFRLCDMTKYPEPCDKIITDIPELVPYME